MRLGKKARSACRHLYSPIIHSLIRSKEHQIQALKDVALLNLPTEEKAHGVVEGHEGLLEHELVACCQRADNVELEIGRGPGEDEVWWEGVDVACSEISTRRLGIEDKI